MSSYLTLISYLHVNVMKLFIMLKKYNYGHKQHINFWKVASFIRIQIKIFSEAWCKSYKNSTLRDYLKNITLNVIFTFFHLAVFHGTVFTKCGFIQLLSIDVYFHCSHELSSFPSEHLLDIHKYILVFELWKFLLIVWVVGYEWERDQIRLDYLEVLFMSNFTSPLISAKKLGTLFSIGLDFKCTALKTKQFSSEVKHRKSSEGR